MRLLCIAELHKHLRKSMSCCSCDEAKVPKANELLGGGCDFLLSEGTLFVDQKMSSNLKMLSLKRFQSFNLKYHPGNQN